MHRLISIALFFVACLGPVAAGAQQGPDGPTLEVTAQGHATAAPDMATLTVGVLREAETAAAALDAMASATASVLARVEEAGIAARDVQTSSLSVSPRFASQEGSRSGPPEIVGYRAETLLTVRVRALDTLGGVIDATVSDGANLFRGLTYGLADPDPVMDAARRAAVAEARRRADLYAEAAGVALGPLLRLSETSGAPRPQMMRAEAMMSDGGGVPVAEGELRLSASVSLVFAIGAP